MRQTSQRDCNGTPQRDKTCPVAVASERDKLPVRGLSRPMRPDAKLRARKAATGQDAAIPPSWLTNQPNQDAKATCRPR